MVVIAAKSASRLRVLDRLARGSGTRCHAPVPGLVQPHTAIVDHRVLRDKSSYLPDTEAWKGGRIPANRIHTLAGESGLHEVFHNRSAHRKHPRKLVEWFAG